jgi:hypothetical protein
MNGIMSGILAVISFIFDKFLVYLSMMEKYIDKNKETASIIAKLFYWKYFNSGVLIIFINWKNTWFGYDVGYYDDFTPSWFQNVGYGIQLTFLAQILMLCLWSFLGVCVPKFWQCRDRGCTTNTALQDGKPNTKKNTQDEFEVLYTGANWEIHVSYAEALKTLFVCFTFSPMMPFLLYIGVLYL